MKSAANARTRVPRIIATLKGNHPDARLALDFFGPLDLFIGLDASQ